MTECSRRFGSHLGRYGIFAAALLLCRATASYCEELQAAAVDLNETVVSVPMTEHGFWGETHRSLTATIYRPVGEGPFPLIILSHGNPPDPRDRVKVDRYRKLAQIREFVKLGFEVIVPIRRGYGATGGTYAEEPGSCKGPDFESAGRQAAQDILATVDYADTLPEVDKNHIVLVGQSAGGFASLAAASYAPKGVVAVVNFSGGRGGRPATDPGQPCEPQRMAKTIGVFASTTTVPVFWHYVENDQYFSPAVVHTWYQSFLDAGGHGELVIEEPFGRDGHGMFAVDRAIPIWLPEFEHFVAGVVPLEK